MMYGPMAKKRPQKPSRRAADTQRFQKEATQSACWIATQLYRARHVDEAIKTLRQALLKDPGQHSASILLAEFLMKRHRIEEIRPVVLASLRRHPTHAKLHFILADVELRCGDLEAADRALTRFQAILDSNPAALGDQRPIFKDMAAILRERMRARARRSAPRAGTADAPAHEAIDSGSPAQPTLFEAATPVVAAGPASRPARIRPHLRAAAPTSTGAVPPAAAVVTREALPATVIDLPDIAVRFEAALSDHAALKQESWSEVLVDREILLEAQRIALVAQFDDLLCLPTLAGVQRLEYQVETARKILRRLNGRALLCDEVGLGKTIEAGMVIKELLLRGLARSVLVLAPAGLVGQWCSEMREKFGLEFDEWGSVRRAERAGIGPVLCVSSLALARHEHNSAAFQDITWDLVVVDEAHHLRRRTTRSWAFVNALRNRYLLLLSATPVHNDLMELYELVTLVKPGLLGTPSEFRRRFVADSNARSPRHDDQLRTLLTDVMVRNTRSHTDVALPQRFATTLVLEPDESEASAYRRASDYVHRVHPEASTMTRQWLRYLLGCAGSGPRALAAAAARRLGTASLELGLEDSSPDAERAAAAPAAMRDSSLLEQVAAAAASTVRSAKADRLLDLVARSDEPMIVFCRFRTTLSELSERLSEAGVVHLVYHGGLSRRDKDTAIERFRNGARVLLSTESGGEGRNIQFCRTIVNYDLPWDPMLIEQRVGRVHRIGQTRDVFVFNLVLAGTVEEEMLRVLEEKIHLFELIVGEVDSILGHLEHGADFAEILLDLWAGGADADERRARFDGFGRQLDAARTAYEEAKRAGDKLFADELEV